MSHARKRPSLETLSRHGAALGVLAVVAGGFASGCQNRGATGGCENLSCGADPGSPVGAWQVSTVCRFPSVSRAAQNYDTTRGYFQPETGAAAPAMTSGPWCWDLSFDKDGMIATPATPQANPDNVVGGTVTFFADHTYVYSLTATSTTPFHVARSCFGVNGANLSCADFAAKLVTSVIGANPTYSNIDPTKPAFRCHDAGDGCDCEFDYLEADQSAVGDKGSWELEGNVIHHFSVAGQGNLFETSPVRRMVRDASFCQTGDTMELTGTQGQPLALKVGSRSLMLTRMPMPPSTTGTGGGGGAAGDTGGAAGDTGGGGAGGAAGSDAATD